MVVPPSGNEAASPPIAVVAAIATPPPNKADTATSTKLSTFKNRFFFIFTLKI
jgi:hypothetical protein